MNAARHGRLIALGTALLVISAVTPRSFAADTRAPVGLSLGQGSELWLEGKSTLHDFESRTSQTRLTLTRDPATPEPNDAATLESLIRSSGLKSVDLEVPVTSLKSEKSGLDKNLWKNLKAEQHPAIHFQLVKYSVVPAGAPGDTMQIHAEGTLEVAGVQRPDTLEARAFRAPQGVWLEGAEPLLMSEFGVRPPSMMLGTLKVADRIVVRYRLLLVPKSESSTSIPSSVH